MDFTRECPECNGKTVRLVQCQLCKNVKCKHSQALKYLSPTDWFMMLTDEEKETLVDMLQNAYDRFRKQHGVAHA